MNPHVPVMHCAKTGNHPGVYQEGNALSAQMWEYLYNGTIKIDQ